MQKLQIFRAGTYLARFFSPLHRKSLHNLLHNEGGTDNMAFKHLSSMSPNEAGGFLDSFDTIIFDCDGVLWNYGPIAGVAETITKLEAIGKNMYFLSNNSVKKYQTYVKQFQEVNISLKPENLVHPSITIVEYLKEIGFKKKAFCIVTSMFLEYLEAGGITCCTTEGNCQEDLKSFLEISEDDPEVGAVIIDLDLNVNYLKISKALSILQRPDVLFIVGSTETILPVPNRPNFVGPGPFVKMISELSGRQPMTMGKPSLYLRTFINKRFKISDPKRTLMIGDTIDNDMAFGHLCGFQKLLVMSEDSISELASATEEVEHQPDFVIETLGHMNEVIENAELR